MTDVREILKQAAGMNASDVFMVPGAPVSVKCNGSVQPLAGERLTPEDTLALARQIYQIDGARSMEHLQTAGDDDFSVSIAQTGRFRCSAYRQRNSYALVLRIVSFRLPEPESLHIPAEVTALATVRKGLILVTGPAGSGKSTTLACLIDRINAEYADHIITIEDPIEFIHPHKRSIVSQREVAHDTLSYASALRAALRQTPDVILLGEMRDLETTQTAMTAAETGQLVLSTLHTIGAATTIDRIIDVFPANQQQQVRVQLSMTLRAVVSQQLIPTVDGGIEPAFEIMRVNSAVRNMIREGKVHQMDNVIYAGAAEGMHTMDADIERLYRAGRISRENALLYAGSREIMAKKLS